MAAYRDRGLERERESKRAIERGRERDKTSKIMLVRYGNRVT